MQMKLGSVVVLAALFASVSGVTWFPNQTATTVTITNITSHMGKGDFTLPIVNREGLTGKTLTLSDSLGKVIVLEFMGPWCPPCQQLTQFMESLYKQFAADGVVFTAVAEPWNPQWNSHYQNVTVEQFLSEYNSSLTYVLDSPDWQVGTMYGIPSVPTLFILSKAGTVGYTYNGAGDITGNATTAIDAMLAQAVAIETAQELPTTSAGLFPTPYIVAAIVLLGIGVAAAIVITRRKNKR